MALATGPIGRSESKVLDKDAILYLETDFFGADGKALTMYGGAVCVDPSGIVVTVAHNLPEGYEAVYLRTWADPAECWEAEEVHMCREFELCVLQIKPENQKGNREVKFGFINLDGRSWFLHSNERLFSFLHQGQIPFSLFHGETSYHFKRPPPRPTELEEGMQLMTHESYADAEFLNAKSERRPFRTAATVIVVREALKNGVFDLLDLHPDLPLVETHGLRTKPGSSGCPVFKSSNGCCIGVICFNYLGMDYIIPTPFIRDFVTDALKKKAKAKAKVEAKAGGSKASTSRRGGPTAQGASSSHASKVPNKTKGKFSDVGMKLNSLRRMGCAL